MGEAHIHSIKFIKYFPMCQTLKIKDTSEKAISYPFEVSIPVEKDRSETINIITK